MLKNIAFNIKLKQKWAVKSDTLVLIDLNLECPYLTRRLKQICALEIVWDKPG